MSRRIILVAFALLLLLSGCTSEKKEYGKHSGGRFRTWSPRYLSLK
jgi:predicted component of type VI protein secretion system